MKKPHDLYTVRLNIRISADQLSFLSSLSDVLNKSVSDCVRIIIDSYSSRLGGCEDENKETYFND